MRGLAKLRTAIVGLMAAAVLALAARLLTGPAPAAERLAVLLCMVAGALSVAFVLDLVLRAHRRSLRRRTSNYGEA